MHFFSLDFSFSSLSLSHSLTHSLVKVFIFVSIEEKNIFFPPKNFVIRMRCENRTVIENMQFSCSSNQKANVIQLDRYTRPNIQKIQQQIQSLISQIYCQMSVDVLLYFRFFFNTKIFERSLSCRIRTVSTSNTTTIGCSCTISTRR